MAGAGRGTARRATWGRRARPRRRLRPLHQVYAIPSATTTLTCARTLAHHLLWGSPTQAWSALTRLLEADEQARLARLRRAEDQRRALVGALLVRCHLSRTHSLPLGTFAVPRDGRGRPYFAAPAPAAPPTQFNLSHHGEYVVFAAHPTARVGIDVMDCEQPAGATVNQFLSDLRDQVGACRPGDAQRCTARSPPVHRPESPGPAVS